MSNVPTIQRRQIWLIFFFLGVIMLNFPFLQIFNHPYYICGIPILVLYLLLGWPLSIVVIYVFSRAIEKDDLQPPESRQ